MIRDAKIEDIPRINELGLLLNDKFTKVFKMEEILDESISKVYVYVEDDNVVGFLHVTMLYETMDIINLVVDPHHRRKQIASNLFDYLISETPSSVRLITLEVNEKNNSAIKLYEKFGFKIINRRPAYYHEDDALLMGRDL